MKGRYDLRTKFRQVRNENCLISEITLAELKFGVENSQRRDENAVALEHFLSGVTIIPIFSCFDVYAKEKARLRKLGQPVDDFDLLIGATAVANNLIMVTNNQSHFARIQKIYMEDWTA